MTASRNRAWGALLFLCAIMACAALTGAAPAAAQDRTYLKEYKAYTAALNAGDKQAAARHGYAAWQAAEAELGDHELTAVLAYNYGQLVLFEDTVGALAALRRANGLATAGIGELPASDLGLFVTYAEFIVGGEKRREARALRNALNVIEGEGAPVTLESATMWFQLATSDLRDERYRDAKSSAAKAASYVAIAFPQDYRLHASAILLEGIATLVPFPRKTQTMLEAHMLFTRARLLFPLQKDIDAFDPVLAKVLAWDAATTAAMITEGRDAYPEHDHPEGRHDWYFPELFGLSRSTAEECGVDWDSRKPPTFPRLPLRKGFIGAVLVAYSFGDDNAVHDAKILAEVPDEVFGQAALAAVAKWKLSAPVPDTPACLLYQMTQFTFVITN